MRRLGRWVAHHVFSQHCCVGWFNGAGVECDDKCACLSCVEQREGV